MGRLIAELQVKTAYVGTLGNADLNNCVGDITSMVNTVNANPNVAVTMLMTGLKPDGSFIIPTEALHKLHDSIKDNKNGDNKVNVFSKMLFHNRIAAMVAMENAFKALKEFDTGGFDIAVKYMLFSQYFDEGNIYYPMEVY